MRESQAERLARPDDQSGGATRRSDLFGLRPIPPPCLGCGSEASWTPVGVSWGASGEPVGGSFMASWGLLGPLLGVLGASWGLLWSSWGPLVASWGLLGAS